MNQRFSFTTRYQDISTKSISDSIPSISFLDLTHYQYIINNIDLNSSPSNSILSIWTQIEFRLYFNNSCHLTWTTITVSNRYSSRFQLQIEPVNINFKINLIPSKITFDTIMNTIKIEFWLKRTLIWFLEMRKRKRESRTNWSIIEKRTLECTTVKAMTNKMYLGLNGFNNIWAQTKKSDQSGLISWRVYE